MLTRYILPVLALIVVYRTTRSLLLGETDCEEWGYLCLPNGAQIILNHWENNIGRSKSSDVYMEYPTLSRIHAAVIRDVKGKWRVHDIGSKSGVIVNGKRVFGTAEIKTGDIIVLGGVELVFVTLGREAQNELTETRVRPCNVIRPFFTLLFLTAFQVILAIQLCISMGTSLTAAIPMSFIGLIIIMWLCYLLTRILQRVAFEVETIAFFLCTCGFAVTASSSPDDLFRQLTIVIAGVGLYFLIGWFLRDLNRAVKLRWPIAIAGLVLLAVNLVFGGTVFGAKNWLTFGGLTFQPSEFVKITFVFAGAATLERLFAKRNLVLFIVFSGACVIALALMKDFGSALVFFVAYLTISFIRSGDLATVFLSIAGAVFAGFMAVTFRPYIAERFATWGHAWEYVNAAGFQQTRAMSAAASGGLFGVGAGSGWFKHIFAADTDMVFGVMCEELGLILACATIAALLVLLLHAMRSSKSARSSFYVIGACAAASIIVFQMLLNVLGSVDILPFTGVTFPFVSKGGSSLVACWGLLAFIKASDTRRNASFSVRTPKHIAKKEMKAQRRRVGQIDDDDMDADDFDLEYDFESYEDIDYDDNENDFDD